MLPWPAGMRTSLVRRPMTPTWRGATGCSVRYVVEAMMEDGAVRKCYESVRIGPDEAWQPDSAKEDLHLLSAVGPATSGPHGGPDFAAIRKRVEAAIADSEARVRGEHGKVQSVRTMLVGLACYR